MIIEHPREDQLVTCSAETMLGLLRAHCASQGHELPLAGEDGAAVGALLETGGVLPRRARWGFLRDVAVEVRFRRRDGSVCRSGAPLHKSVSGYDLGKVLIGSGGRLASITQMTLRTVPRPERTWEAMAPCDSSVEATRLALALRADVPELDALSCTSTTEGAYVHVVLAGDADEVESLRARCLAHASFHEAELPRLPLSTIAVRASATVTTSARLCAAPAHAARADLLFGGVELEADPSDPASWLATLRVEVATERGHVHVRRAPSSLALDPWGPLDADLATLHAKIEQAFA